MYLRVLVFDLISVPNLNLIQSLVGKPCPCLVLWIIKCRVLRNECDIVAKIMSQGTLKTVKRKKIQS